LAIADANYALFLMTLSITPDAAPDAANEVG